MHLLLFFSSKIVSKSTVRLDPGFPFLQLQQLVQQDNAKCQSKVNIC